MSTASGGPVPSSRPAGSGRPGRASRPPARSAEHGDLSLDELRAYRRCLLEEESRVAYWQRLLRVRLDVLSGSRVPSTELERYRRVLTDANLTRVRSEILDFVPGDDLPAVPDLLGLWAVGTDPADVQQCRAAVRDVTAVDEQLAGYGVAVLHRLERATSELIARYREDPRLCLTIPPYGGD